MPEALKKVFGTTVAFGDVVQLSKERSKDPEADGLERCLGLEHLEPGELKVRRWGYIADGTKFTNVFRPDQVLFGKRRAYQRKVAVADFSGVCSGDIYVLEPKGDQLMPELLPFICQSEPFYDYVISMSQGGLSPRVNWKALAKYEFALPPLEEQRRFLGILAATEEVLVSHRNVQVEAFRLFRSTIDALYEGQGRDELKYVDKLGRVPKEWPVMRLEEVCTKVTDGVHKRPDYVSDGVPFLSVENLTRGPGIDYTTKRYVTEEAHREYIRRANPERGDVLLAGKGATLGAARVIETDDPFSIFVSVALMKPKSNILNSWFLRYFLESSLFLRRLASLVTGSALPQIHLIDLRSTLIPLPSIQEQEAIVSRIRAADSAYRRAIDRTLESAALGSNVLNNILDGDS